MGFNLFTVQLLLPRHCRLQGIVNNSINIYKKGAMKEERMGKRGKGVK
jgi:hypothetical protein